MNKNWFATVTAVAVAFVTAIGLCVRALLAPQTVFSASQTEMRIVLDAGHGGVDGGVVGKTTGVKESDLNLAVTFRLKEAFEDMGFAVTLTRKTDAGLYGTTAKGFKKRDMQKRKEIVENADPALVLSVHQNFYPSSTSRGAQVFYSKKREESKRLALALQSSLNALYKTEGVKGRNASSGEYFMLECTSAPSVILECGFLSSPADEALLQSVAWQRKLAESVVAGVMAFLGDFVL